MSEIKAQLGGGVFTLSDVSHILKLPRRRVSYWLNEYWDNKFSVVRGKRYSWGNDHKAINFYTLIEFYVYYMLREFSMSSKKINAAQAILAEYFETDYPFANAKLLTDKKICIVYIAFINKRV